MDIVGRLWLPWLESHDCIKAMIFSWNNWNHSFLLEWFVFMKWCEFDYPTTSVQWRTMLRAVSRINNEEPHPPVFYDQTHQQMSSNCLILYLKVETFFDWIELFHFVENVTFLNMVKTKPHTLGSWTMGHRMVGADISTELWRHP